MDGPTAARLQRRRSEKGMKQATPSPYAMCGGGSRRGFVGGLLSGFAAILSMVLTAFGRARSSGAEDTAATGKELKRNWGMVIDLDRCIGCGTCVVACKAENNVSDGTPDRKWDGRRIAWMTLRQETTGQYPHASTVTRPVPCNHCTDAACVKVCPVGATYLSDEGIVAVIWDQCIGCRYCVTACPYSRRYFNWFAPQYDNETRLMLNPDVATRPVGIVEKCTFCHHRIRAAKLLAKQQARELADGDIQTACQEACPARAIAFGDLNDPDSKVSRASKKPRAHRLFEALGTNPKVFYLERGCG